MKVVILFLFGILNFSNTQPISQKINSMQKNKNYAVEIIRYSIPSDQQASFEEAYSKAGVFLQNSPYCLSYEVVQGSDEPQHYIVRIHWTSVDDHLTKFRKSAEFMSFFNLVKPFYNNIDEMKHYEETSIAWRK